MPLTVRLIGLFSLGTLLGSVINLAICRLAYQQTTISPWSRRDRHTPPRRWADRLPIGGWIFLRRETSIHGRGFWVRPMLIELAMGVGLAWLYVWEVVDSGLIMGQLANFLSADQIAAWVLPTADAHWLFLSHVLLITLMAVASFIDINEKIIPDEVTVPGTVMGLVMAAFFPWSLLPHVGGLDASSVFGHIVEFTDGGFLLLNNRAVYIQFLTLASPLDWPASLVGLAGLALGLGCYGFWCFAILPRRRRVWYARHGFRRACQLLAAQVRASLRATHVRVLIPLGTLGIVTAWWMGGVHWAGLLTALLGLTGGGAMVWAVRVIGSVTLKKEAMGFGDVTLMMMIGTFVGWQASLIVFFLAPFAGLVLGLVQLIVRRDHEIPYGPFLCLATLTVLVRWADIWSWASPIFDWPWLVPMAIGFCLIAMTLLLSLWRRLVVSFGRR